MIFGHLDRPESYAGLLMDDDWRFVFWWAIEHRTQLPKDGEHVLREGVRAIVKTVQTKERSAGVFEAHQREVDIHVCMGGSEVIEVESLHKLRPRTAYDAENDCMLYDTPASTRRIEMRSGTFAVFFPEDGHMPELTLEHPETRKIVFKVPYVEMQ